QAAISYRLGGTRCPQHVGQDCGFAARYLAPWAIHRHRLQRSRSTFIAILFIGSSPTRIFASPRVRESRLQRSPIISDFLGCCYPRFATANPSCGGLELNTAPLALSTFSLL